MIAVLAVGRATKGPERELIERYGSRLSRAGRRLGVTGLDLREFAEAAGSGGARQEGERLLAARAPGVLVALDERGERWDSVGLATRLQGWLDGGKGAATFAVGGADGHADTVLRASDHVFSLGALTLPHLLARVVLLEQLYRAVTIRLGHPYHRA